MGDSVHVWVAPAGPDQHAAGRDLLLELAGMLLDRPAELRYEPAGRPLVGGLAVSISHSRNLVAAAASPTGRIGIDIEDICPREVSGLARRWFDPSELDWMAQQPDELIAFLHLWTAKEAVGKARGQGLRKSGLRRRMPLPDGPVPSEAGLTVLHLPIAQAVLAVALPAATSEVVLTEHHGAAVRRIVTSRTSFPVVVRGS
ncbi:4'-phosphopantetheinyl transferase superfamily protein [Kribbella turkmenica]|uniref:4'-phosphopantetheinyl transferase superfamily protein n=1 Tax=Kribbella turkmenica TaxID=2530375 RepID=A0A4R4W347_9ACTN|nr:4'-phosphopantetheinyl transferase superfamily protein [Kribbella turkmenica]TDD13009.1 4'-phosphopantetheinyl transferase superfamily protein [Kribbella turkmenica]